MNTCSFKTAVLCLSLGVASLARAAELPLPKDGWASWQVDAVEGAEAWCCWSSWDDRVADTTPCKLDGERQGYGTRGKKTTDAVRVYARFANGSVERLRALAATCPVETKTPIQKLDNVSTDDSARWLINLSKTQPVASEDQEQDLLAALAMHRGNVAFDALSEMARTDARTEARKHAIFWLAMMRGTAGADIVSRTMFSDQDAEVRKHAAFAITESKSTHMAADLIRQGNADGDGDVRAQAWFWLAQSGAPNAEQAITAASRQDKDDHVREQAVFALSQLPEDRAVRALIATAQDRSLATEQRKRALFWLAQSESKDATTYLDKVLTGNNTR